MSVFKWPVMPLCAAQRKDVRPEDILHGGLFRLCDTYRGGGGYDQFNKIYYDRTDENINPTHFVIQLQGCPLKCDYCKIKDIRSSIDVSLGTLIDIYNDTNLDVFHLTGAPARYLEYWKRLAYAPKVFYSDFLLIEQPYEYDWVNHLPGLHVVSIKESKYYSADQLKLLVPNLKVLCAADMNWYMTFTGPCNDIKDMFVDTFGYDILDESFDIKIT